MGFGLGLDILRGIFSKTGLKIMGLLIVLGVVGGFLHHEYTVVHDRIFAEGVAQQAKVTDQWKAKTAKAEAQSAKDKLELARYVKGYNDYVDKTTRQQAELAVKQKHIVEALAAKLDAVHKQLATTKRLNDEISNYIPPPDDLSCSMPTGLLLLYNRSLQDTAPAGGFLTPGSGYAFSASGVSCRTFASVLVLNNADAVQYRSLLILWQTWYKSNEAVFKTYQQEHQATAPPSTTLPAS